MIRRIVLIKLDEEWATAPRRREIAEHSLRVLRDVPGVETVSVGTAADDRAAADWDVCLEVRLTSADALPSYAADPGHRAYVDDYLKPKAAKLRAWNFEPIGSPGDR